MYIRLLFLPDPVSGDSVFEKRRILSMWEKSIHEIIFPRELKIACRHTRGLWLVIPVPSSKKVPPELHGLL
jgi:hypothetical protein